MGTRSTIAIRRQDGTHTSIYCHWDGYLDHHWPILTGHYATAERVEALLALGDLSSLGARLAPDEGEAHSFRVPAEGVCVAYGREREETGVAARHYGGPGEFRVLLQRQEYNYLFDEATATWTWSKG